MHGRTPRHITLLATAMLSVSTGCGGTLWSTIDFGTLPGADSFPDDHGIVLEEHCDASFGLDEASGTPYHDETIRIRLRLLTEAGRKSHDDYAIYYDGARDTLEDVAARIVKPSGKSIPIESWTEHPVSGSGNLHSTTRYRFIDFELADPGDVIELRWRRRSFTAFLGQSWSFTGHWPVVLSRLALTLPAGAKVDTAFTEGGTYGTFEPQRERLEGGASRLTWERRDSPKRPTDIAYAPPSRTRGAAIRYALRKLPGAGVTDGVMTSWRDYGDWYNHLLKGTGEITPQVRTIATEVLANAPESPRDRVAALYRHVQDTVRYVSIQLGMGGWRPTPADEVAAQGLGDCKDMASYLKTLLAVDGIDSDLVAVGTRSSFLPTTPGPNLRGHNHVILAVNLPDQAPHFLDVTCRTCGMDDLPWGDQGTDVVITTVGNTRLVKTPVSAPSASKRLRRYEMTLGPDGTANFRLAYEATGLFGKGDRSALFVMNLKERERWLRRKVGGHGAVKTTTAEVHDETDFNVPLTISLAGHYGRLAKGSGALWTLGVSSFLSPPMARIPKDRAAMPAHLGHPYSAHMEARIQLPGAFTIESVPEPAKLDTPYGRYARSFEVQKTADGAGQVLVITRNFDRIATIVPIDEVSALRDFATAVRKHERAEAVLTRQ